MVAGWHVPANKSLDQLMRVIIFALAPLKAAWWRYFCLLLPKESEAIQL